MNTEQIQKHLESRWQYSRKEERKRWVKRPDDWADYMAASAFRGYVFLKISDERWEQIREEKKAIRIQALEFIKGRTP
jgi:hypothetical protein